MRKDPGQCNAVTFPCTLSMALQWPGQLVLGPGIGQE